VPVQDTIRAEMRAVSTNDLTAFMALQDPDDQTWRTLQERNFGRLNARVCQSMAGWRTGVPPQIGPISQSPGGALVQMTYNSA